MGPGPWARGLGLSTEVKQLESIVFGTASVEAFDVGGGADVSDEEVCRLF